MKRILVVLSSFVCLTVLLFAAINFLDRGYINIATYEFLNAFFPCLFIWFTFYQTWKMQKIGKGLRLILAVIIVGLLYMWFPWFFLIFKDPLASYSPFYLVYAIILTAIIGMYFSKAYDDDQKYFGGPALLLFSIGFSVILFFILSAILMSVMAWMVPSQNPVGLVTVVTFLASALKVICAGILLVTFAYFKRTGIERTGKHVILLGVMGIIIALIAVGSLWGIPQNFII